MTEEIKTTTPVASPPPTVPQRSDGFDFADDAGNSIIRGVKIPFTNNAEYLAGSGGEVIKSPPREFIAVEHLRALQKWPTDEGPPLETRVLEPDEYFPDIEVLNSQAPQSEWRTVFGQKKGPWEKVHALYLLEQESMAAFTFITGTVGGFRAVRELTEAIKRARMLGNPYLFPVVNLTHTFMPTQYGGRERPQFKVVRWIEIGKPAEKPALAKPKNADMDGDSIPF